MASTCIPHVNISASVLTLGAFATAYVLASCSEVLLVKLLNYKADVWLPFFAALLVNQVWIFLAVPYAIQLRQLKQSPGFQHLLGPPNTNSSITKPQMYKAYAAMTVLTIAITCFRNIAANAIPGSVSSLLISTSIAFNMVLCRIVLKRKFNRFHIVAGLCCLSAAMAIAVSVWVEMQDTLNNGIGHNYFIGVPFALMTAVCIAAMSVWSDAVVSEWPFKEFRITEMTIVASLFATVASIVLAAATGEIRQWSGELQPALQQFGPRVALVLGIVFLPITKATVRTAKYQTIALSSAFFFEFVQASGALLASISSVLVYGESWTYGYIAALVLIATGYLAYIRGRMEDKIIARAAVQAFELPAKVRKGSRAEYRANETCAAGDLHDHTDTPPFPARFVVAPIPTDRRNVVVVDPFCISESLSSVTSPESSVSRFPRRFRVPSDHDAHVRVEVDAVASGHPKSAAEAQQPSATNDREALNVSPRSFSTVSLSSLPVSPPRLGVAQFYNPAAGPAREGMDVRLPTRNGPGGQPQASSESGRGRFV
jgi:hypothetical protein